MSVELNQSRFCSSEVETLLWITQYSCLRQIYNQLDFLPLLSIKICRRPAQVSFVIRCLIGQSMRYVTLVGSDCRFLIDLRMFKLRELFHSCFRSFYEFSLWVVGFNIYFFCLRLFSEKRFTALHVLPSPTYFFSFATLFKRFLEKSSTQFEELFNKILEKIFPYSDFFTLFCQEIRKISIWTRGGSLFQFKFKWILDLKRIISNFTTLDKKNQFSNLPEWISPRLQAEISDLIWKHVRSFTKNFKIPKFSSKNFKVCRDYWA